MLKFRQNRPKNILFSVRSKKAKKQPNNFVSRELFQKRPN